MASLFSGGIWAAYRLSDDAGPGGGSDVSSPFDAFGAFFTTDMVQLNSPVAPISRWVPVAEEDTTRKGTDTEASFDAAFTLELSL